MTGERWRYIGRRLLGLIPLLLIVYTITFLLIAATPGNPFASRSVRALPPEVQAEIEASYGLDRPMPVQYVDYLGNAARGDFGPSYSQQGESVGEVLGPGIPTTLSLVFTAIVIGVVIGIPLGVVAANRRGRPMDHAIGMGTTLGVAVPVFVSVPVLIIVLGVYLGLVPTAGWDGLLSRSAIVPLLALAAEPAAVVAWFTRASMIEVMSSDPIRTARAQGLRRRTIRYQRGLRNGLVPVLTITGIEVAALFASVFYVEQIANIPGFGRELIAALGARDFPVIMAGTLFVTLLIALVNLLVDVAYGFADPRVSLQ